MGHDAFVNSNSPPKIMNYAPDGSGRDMYIKIGNGGNYH